MAGRCYFTMLLFKTEMSAIQMVFLFVEPTMENTWTPQFTLSKVALHHISLQGLCPDFFLCFIL